MNAATGSLISTQTVPALERAAYWRDLICDTFVELDCDRIGEGFYGELDDRPVGALQLTRVRSSAHVATRSQRQIAKSSDDSFLISLQISGVGEVTQDGRTASLTPGDFALYDSTRRYQLQFEGQFEELVLKLPRAMITDRIATPESITARRITGGQGMGRLAFNFVRSVASELDVVPSADAPALSRNIVELLGSAVSAQCGSGMHRSTSMASQLLRAKMLVGESLQMPDLNKDSLALKMGISSRYLSKLFAQEGMSFTEWVREQRLSRIAEDLVKPGLSARSISSIAYGWGMNSMPHFSRVFRAHFGCTPRHYRASALASNCSH